LKNFIRQLYKYWPVWLVLLVIGGWPQVNDWEWDSAKQEARTLIAQFESEKDAQAAAQAKAPAGTTLPVHPVAVEMSKLTCMAANSFFSPYWQMNASFRVKLMQAFVWHGYAVEIPGVRSVGERGCGRTDDGKYQFGGT
jgi:hypothetical protein